LGSVKNSCGKLAERNQVINCILKGDAAPVEVPKAQVRQ